MTSILSLDAWVKCWQPNTKARSRLFCFPYAGGSASVFRKWPQIIDADIEICAIQLPGREERFSEPLLHHFDTVIEHITQALQPYLDRPYAFFGHSMGALLAFECAHQLRKQGHPEPQHLFASACRAPHLPDTEPLLHNLSNQDFVVALRQLQGTPEIILQNAELMTQLLPLLRADFSVSESFCYRAHTPLICSITIFGGADDPHTNNLTLDAWQQHTENILSKHIFLGGHFFLHEQSQALISHISTTVNFISLSTTHHA